MSEDLQVIDFSTQNEDFLAIFDKTEVEVSDIGRLGISFFQINEDDLSGDIEKQAAYYAFWATAEADAYRDVANAKLQLKVTIARAHRDLKALNPKMTIPDLKAEVECFSNVVDAEQEFVNVEHRHRMIKAIVQALQQKKDMLSSKTGLMRTEMELHMKKLGLKVLGGMEDG
jgi:hypothetical protein